MTDYIIYKDKDGEEIKLYFHRSGNLVYPSKIKEGALEELPKGYKVKYRNGFPVCKKV